MIKVECPNLTTIFHIYLILTNLNHYSIGTYPNVCMHKEKRKVLTAEARNALVHKSR